jgi:major vault protein
MVPKAGIHIKINCDYTDPAWPTASGTVDRDFKEGDEIFITGETHPIYYPQEEHSIVRYGDQLVHFATAVSAGQARYVMNKKTGIITTHEGPDMILLNPIDEVFVTRVLSDAESLLMYPGNQDSLAYNQSLRAFQVQSGTEKEILTSRALAADYEDFGGNQLRSFKSRSAAAPAAALPDQIRRKTDYTKPHSITLDDRFSGAPTLKIWTGFAVLLTKADGTRRVELGPQVVVLDFDETVSPLHLSTDKPKTTDKLLTTGFLEVRNNKVSDILEVETLDGVTIRLKLSYRVSFTGDKMKWFDVDNYVKFLCDHVRSRLKGVARRFNVRQFYNDTVAIVRDNILGEKIADEARIGLLFAENGMVITDVELLAVDITDSKIESLLIDQQQAVVTNQIEIDRARQQLEVETAAQKLDVARLALKNELRQERHTLELAQIADEIELADKNAAANFQRAEDATVLAEEVEKANLLKHQADMARREALQALTISLNNNETENIVERFKAAEGDLSAAILQLGDEHVLASVAEAMGPMKIIGGGTITDALAGLIGSPGNRNALFERLSGVLDNGSKLSANA